MTGDAVVVVVMVDSNDVNGFDDDEVVVSNGEDVVSGIADAVECPDIEIGDDSSELVTLANVEEFVDDKVGTAEIFSNGDGDENGSGVLVICVWRGWFWEGCELGASCDKVDSD